MPLKRKATTPHREELPTKRRTRLGGLLLSHAQPPPPTLNKKKVSHVLPNGDNHARSSKNQKIHESESTDDVESSEDELILSPSRVVIPALSTEYPETPMKSASHLNAVPTTPQASLSEITKSICSSPSPHRLPQTVSAHLYPCLNAQKRAILRALQQPLDLFDNAVKGDEGDVTNAVAFQQLTDLLAGTVTRGEGNSCLILGPRGSGKTGIVERCISNLSGVNPLILRLSGWTQHTDRLAMHEIAYQLGQQTGRPFLSQIDNTPLPTDVGDFDGGEVNPFLDTTPSAKISAPQSTHLPALISVLPTLSRPTVVVLDGFDLFALHPRQSLLYCLLDTAQSCRATAGSQGLAVVGVTSRIDTITILEKRVKSRFSGRMFRCAPPRRLQNWENMVRMIMSSEIGDFAGAEVEETLAEWRAIWHVAVKNFLEDRATRNILHETFSITQDIRMLSRILLPIVLHISPDSPFPSSSQFALGAMAQRARPRFPLMHVLPYPELCLLIASVHAETAGHPVFTFEMLHEYFCHQVRASTSAPVQVNGGGIGMVRCSRQVLMSAFEDLLVTKIFISIAPYAPGVTKEFVKYRSVVNRDEVKKAIDKTRQVNLRKWLTKAK